MLRGLRVTMCIRIEETCIGERTVRRRKEAGWVAGDEARHDTIPGFSTSNNHKGVTIANEIDEGTRPAPLGTQHHKPGFSSVDLLGPHEGMATEVDLFHVERMT